MRMCLCVNMLPFSLKPASIAYMLTHCLAKETIFWDLKALIHLKNVEADGEPLYGTTTDGVTYKYVLPFSLN